MKTSIVIPTHNRASLFRHSLRCYAAQTEKDFEIILLDDGSTDDMQKVCREFAPSLGLEVKHFWFGGRQQWRDGCCQINYGIRAAVGDFIITTSPEVMPGRFAIQRMLENRDRNGGNNSECWFSAKTYLLSPNHTDLIHESNYAEIGAPEAARLLPDFYKAPSAEFNGCKDYFPCVMDKEPNFGASFFIGMTRKGWRVVGGQPEIAVWGSPDTSFLNERNRRGIRVVTTQEMDGYCVHQNHDRTDAPPRDMQKCFQNEIKGPWDFIRW